MSEKIISGRGGAVNGQPCVDFWKVARRSRLAKAECSAAGGAVVRGPGIFDWRGIYTGYGHTPSVLPGEVFQFKGNTRDGKGAQSAASGAILDRTEITWDIEDGKFIRFANQFSCATGDISFGDVTASDGSIPEPSGPRDCTLDLTGCTELRKMKLVLMCKNPPAVTSSTSGGTERDEGNKDALFECTIYTKDASFPDESAIATINFGVGGGLSWTMKSSIVTLVAPLLPIRGGYFQADLAGEWTAFTGGAQGTITTPAGALWWP